jgi:hypothetical protein
LRTRRPTRVRIPAEAGNVPFYRALICEEITILDRDATAASIADGNTEAEARTQ